MGAVPWLDAETDASYLERVLRAGAVEGLTFRRGGTAELGYQLPQGVSPKRPDKALPYEVRRTP